MISLVPILCGVFLWNYLPDTIAIHFDINNNPDNFASKGFVVFGLPVFMAILQAVVCIINDIESHKHSERKQPEILTKWIIPVMSIMVVSLICSLFIIPIVWFIQCIDCIKTKKDNDEILRNILFWIFLALISLYVYNDNKATDECMAECVLPDKSNYEECRDSRCD